MTVPATATAQLAEAAPASAFTAVCIPGARNVPGQETGHRAAGVERAIPARKAAQRLGFTLEEIAELLDTGRRGHPTPDLRARAQAKIADLTTIRAAPTEVVSAGWDSLTNCTCPDCPLPFADLAEGRLPKEN
ncbi:MerR family DNA-binding protein [Nonomuraea rubra]|uniref:MerR family DNA-binding protein n=1 Tax=Nonomuraea rubra TaxID=46180 RepID=UPI00360625C7